MLGFDYRLNMFCHEKYTRSDFLNKIKNVKNNYINLELIINKYNIGIGKKQLYIKDGNIIDHSNLVYNCKNLRYRIFSYFGENHYGDLRYIFNLDKSKDFNIILNRNKNILFDNKINSLYNGFLKKTEHEYNITKLPLFRIFNLGNLQNTIYGKILYKLNGGRIFSIPTIKKFLNKYNISISKKSNNNCIIDFLDILIRNYSKYEMDNEINLRMIIEIFEDNSKIFFNINYVIDYSISFNNNC